ncbi:hypothetical protein [Achromobacter insuavis]|uniref:hypothetical protein n=1 Tax=Achromobacter insuavis TaxID=1287735 RepID=UPI0012F48AC2|nr:hypothetical protein [Achromobacter insuavis]
MQPWPLFQRWRHLAAPTEPGTIYSIVLILHGEDYPSVKFTPGQSWTYPCLTGHAFEPAAACRLRNVAY